MTTTRGLMGLYEVGNSGMRAARAVIGTTGKNVTNATTAGYSKQTQATSATPPFAGVTLGGISRAQDNLLMAREQSADATLARADDLRTTLEAVEARITNGDINVVDAIANLFGGFVELSASPASTPLRQQAVGNANSLAAAFQQASNQVAQGRAAADGDISQLAQHATRLAASIAETNDVISRGNTDPAVADERDRLSRELASIVGGGAQTGSDGVTRFVLESGHSLVDGSRANALVASPDPANDGHLRVSMQAGNINHDLGTPSTGRIGGLIDARDRVLGGTAQRLDQLAFDISTSMNQAHSAGQGLDGSSGRELFVQSATVEGAASRMAVNGDILADTNALATASAGAGPGDNGGVRAMAGLRDAPAARGGRTFVDEGIDALASLGSEISRASSQLEAAQTNSDFLAGLRDARSGVSVEEEMSKLAEMQHAHSAAARFVSAVDETFTDLLSRI